MLDAYVIEEIKRREREKGLDRPGVELPLPPPTPGRPPDREDDGGSKDRGVVIIDYSG